MNLTKEEALKKIDELKEYVENFDKKKTLLVYVKKTGPKIGWVKEMSYLAGTVQEVHAQWPGCSYILIKGTDGTFTWQLTAGDYITLEEV